jgi:hypothetical protein
MFARSTVLIDEKVLRDRLGLRRSQTNAVVMRTARPWWGLMSACAIFIRGGHGFRSIIGVIASSRNETGCTSLEARLTAVPTSSGPQNGMSFMALLLQGPLRLVSRCCVEQIEKVVMMHALAAR